MIKLTIFNMIEFLRTVNKCIGEVNVICSDGSKENINKQGGIQRELQNKYIQNKNCLRLALDIPNSKDYFDIVYFSIGEC